MYYFNTRGVVTARYPLTFNSDDATAANLNTSTTHTYSFTNGIWNEAAKRISGLTIPVAVNALIGKAAEPTGGLDINTKAMPIITSNTAANMVLAQSISIGGTTGQTNVSGFVQFGAFGPTDSVTLRGLNVLSRPNVDDVVTIVDLNGTALFTFNVPSSAANPIPFDLNGITVPAGGFGVTTIAGSSIYQWKFDVQPSTV